VPIRIWYIPNKYYYYYHYYYYYYYYYLTKTRGHTHMVENPCLPRWGGDVNICTSVLGIAREIYIYVGCVFRRV